MSSSIIVGDWGSTRLRLWRLECGEIVEHRRGPGIANLESPASTLLAALDGWPAERVVLCGMAGAREGIAAAPYVACPAGVADWKAQAVSSTIGGLSLVIAPGCSSRSDNGWPDVMRGEETQIFGAMALDPALASGRHCLLLPGTHSKWAWLEDGRIARFQTWMTGELYALLRGSSLHFAGPTDPAEESDGFRDGLARAETNQGSLASLFEARAAQVHDGQSPSWAAGFVSGLLIGSEVAAMAATSPTGSLRVIGEPDLTPRYGAALRLFGFPYETAGGDACAIAGLGLLDED